MSWRWSLGLTLSQDYHVFPIIVLKEGDIGYPVQRVSHVHSLFLEVHDLYAVLGQRQCPLAAAACHPWKNSLSLSAWSVRVILCMQ